MIRIRLTKRQFDATYLAWRRPGVYQAHEPKGVWVSFLPSLKGEILLAVYDVAATVSGINKLADA